MNDVLVRAENLSKHYGDHAALDGVSFEIAKGSIVGLIGPNGAGKTTTLKAMLGLTDFEGDLEVLGRDPRRGRHQVMENVCFVADVGILPRWLRVSEAIDFVEGVHPAFDRSKAERLLADTQINRKSRVRQLSKGMVTQLHLALIMSINVELLVLDEPTLGLDILYRKAFYDRLLNDYFDHETSIVITTHQVEEIESLLTHLIFINHGQVVLSEEMDTLSERFLEVTVGPDQVATAMDLKPLYVRELLGRKSMIFEDVDAQWLEGLGEVSVPSVADLFVAKMR